MLAALTAVHLYVGQTRTTNGEDSIVQDHILTGMAGALLGSSFAQPEIESRLAAGGARGSGLI